MVYQTHNRRQLVIVIILDIYRIVSSKSLESSGDVIKPSGGETILVAPTADDGGAKSGSKCC